MRRRRHRPGVVYTGLFIAMLGLIGGSAASASAPSGLAKTPLQQGKAFYRGKTITIITGTVAGSTDIVSRALAPLLGRYLDASVVVVNEGQAGGVPGQDTIAASPPTGLVMGQINVQAVAADTITNTPGFNFNPERLSYVASSAPVPPTMLAVAPSSPYTSFGAVVKASPPARVLAQIPGGGGDTYEMLFGILGMIGAHVQLIGAYSSAPLVAAGFQRGDSNIAVLNYANAETLMQAGLARPIAINVLPAPGMTDRQYVASTPTFSTLIKQYLPKNASTKVRAAAEVLQDFAVLAQPIVTQSKVADYKVVTLRAGVAWAMKQPSYVSAALLAGGWLKYVNPVQAKQAYLTIMKYAADVKCYLETC